MIDESTNSIQDQILPLLQLGWKLFQFLNATNCLRSINMLQNFFFVGIPTVDYSDKNFKGSKSNTFLQVWYGMVRHPFQVECIFDRLNQLIASFWSLLNFGGIFRLSEFRLNSLNSIAYRSISYLITEQSNTHRGPIMYLGTKHKLKAPQKTSSEHQLQFFFLLFHFLI